MRLFRFRIGILPIFFLISCAFAQSQTARPSTTGNSKEPLQNHASLQTEHRFIGWKYANNAHQDTSRWRRSSNFNRPLAHDLNESIPPVPHVPPTSTPDAGFNLRASLPSGYIPTAVTTGDFNEDGKMDFAVSNGGDNTIYVLLGNGDGTFKVPEILYTQGQSPDWITAVQLNNSGHTDLAVTDGDSNLLEIFTGHGDGTFSAGAQVSFTQIPTYILPADINGDGKMDLVVGLTVDIGSTDPQFEVLTGDGTGGFAGTIIPPPVFGSMVGPIPTVWISVGDVNNDGHTDVVATADGMGIVYLNTGNSFTFNSRISPQDRALVVELGDMDEDGCLDAVQSSGTGFLVLSKGNCDGTFATGVNVAELGDIDPAMKVIDLDGDGHLDVVASGAFFSQGGGGSVILQDIWYQCSKDTETEA